VRGDWVDLPDTAGDAPELPPGDWHFQAANSWKLWWADPASSQWSESQRAELVELLALTQDFWLGNLARAAEMRLRADGLGLTLKGKQDRRWRVVPAEVDEPAKKAKSRYQHLKAVPDVGPGT
jgi:hypothetical protein